MTIYNGLKYFTLFFYHDSMIIYLVVVLEYKGIFIVLIDDSLVININFIIKYSIIYNV
jgi:hypothetical protein